MKQFLFFNLEDIKVNLFIKLDCIQSNFMKLILLYEHYLNNKNYLFFIKEILFYKVQNLKIFKFGENLIIIIFKNYD